MTATVISSNLGSGYYQARCTECKWTGTKYEHFSYGRLQADLERENHNLTACP